VAIKDLAQQLRSAIAGRYDDLLRLEQVLTLSLGLKWNEIETRFDKQIASESLALYAVESIPTVDPNVPAGVSDVHFCADLSHSKPLGFGERRDCKLLRAYGGRAVLKSIPEAMS